jgi:hypothetical protein
MRNRGLSMDDVFECIQEYISSNSVSVKSYKDIIRIASEVCGARIKGVEAYRIFKKLRESGSDTQSSAEESRTPFMSPTAALYIAAYSSFGPEAAAKVYSVLEPMITGGSSNIRLLFLPVTSSTMNEQLKLLVELAVKIGVPCSALSPVCSVSFFLDTDSSRKCRRTLRRLCKKVVNNA